MFTGLVEEQGTIEAIAGLGGGSRMVIRAASVVEDLDVGESISVDGVCLTAVEVARKTVAVDLSEETLRRTTLGSKRPGRRCNLERPLKLGARLGGHMVTGHIDGVGSVVEIRPEAEGLWVTVEAPSKVMRYIVTKGSVALDGISLTVAVLTDETFSVAIIPHTAEVTTIGSVRPGTRVNLEADIIGKYVERFVAERLGEGAPQGEGLTRDFLTEHGFAQPRG
jgi:riboflavin synthase